MAQNQEIQAAPIFCDRENHSESQISSLCLRVRCNNSPAYCDKCTQELHKKCEASKQMISEIPKLLESHLQIKTDLIQLLEQIKSGISQLIATIEQHIMPISIYKENPKLENLNNVGVFLKAQVPVASINEIEQTEQRIQNIFDQVKAKCLQNNQEYQIRKSVQKWILGGKALLELNKFNYAIECSDEVFKTSPKNVDALILGGRALLGQQKIEKAREFCEQALIIDQNKAEAWILKGMLLYWKDQYVEVLECAKYALNIDPNIADIWILRGKALSALKHQDCALECFEQALKIDPMNLDALIFKGIIQVKCRGYVLFGSCEYKKALQQVEQALKISPSNENAIKLKNSIQSVM